MTRRAVQVNKILSAGFYMAGGAIFFKFLPMSVWGNSILYDASFHIITAVFVIYIIWFLIDQNHNWHMPFFIFAATVLFVISVQRIIADAHNDVGLLLGFAIAVLSIGVAERKSLKGKLKF